MANLTSLRQQLDEIDKELFVLLAKRFSVTQQVGIYKRDHGLPVKDPQREAQQYVRIRALAKEKGLDEDFAQKLLELIIEEVIKNHKALRKDNGS